jgi:D-glycero-D-manno-heptose 1,7-bisphosphate phosphatase
MKRGSAVFLDRDGVLNEVVVREGRPESPRTPEELELVPDLSSVQRLAAAGFMTFIITNQPDIGRGRITQQALDGMMARILDAVPITDYRVCLHDDADNCDCRKPKPGMILDLAQCWHVDLDQSWVIGDMWRDVDAARAAGCTSVLIRRDYNDDARPDIAVGSLSAAVDAVLGETAS